MNLSKTKDDSDDGKARFEFGVMNDDAKHLLHNKQSGYTRTSPQSQPQKTQKQQCVKCQVCGEMFATRTQLEEHVSKHTSDEEWNCDDCAFQTNTKESLQQHKSRATHVSENQTPIENFRCSLCGKAFTYKNDIINHKSKDHKSFKRCNKLPNCEYKDNCMYNHNKVPANMFMC